MISCDTWSPSEPPGQSWGGQTHVKAGFPCQKGVLGQLMTFVASSGPSLHPQTLASFRNY